MADVFVPSEMRPALVQLAALGDDAISELCSLLEANPDVLTSRQAAFEHASKLTKFGDEGFSAIDAVVPLLFLKASSGKSTADLVKEITARLVTGDKQEATLSTAAVPNFKKNLGRILELSKLTNRAKALSLATDSQRLFSDAKIVSDVRPVFGEDVSKPPLGAVILHSLKIGFAEDGEEREFFVTMDSKDLRELQSWITRALSKDATLSQFIKHSNIEQFETSK